MSRWPRPSPIEWLCLAAGAFLTLRYAWLLDDAFVYFRYADNLVFLGHGLVYNAGEYVEGYSSPVWMLLVAALRATGLDFWLLVRALGLVCFGLFWAGLVWIDRRASPAEAPVVNAPLCYLTLNYAVLCYFTSGMDTPLVQLAAVLYAAFALRPASRPLQALLALTPLVRHELALPFALCWLWQWRRERRFPAAMTLWALGLNGSWLAFRIVTYADLLPNTFYLKNDTSPLQGWHYLLDTALPYWLWAYLGAHAAVFLWLRRRGVVDSIAGRRLLMLALAGALTLYVVKIGGDARHYRYLAFPLVLSVCATAGLAERLLASLAPRRAQLVAAAAGLALALLAASFRPQQLDAHPLRDATHTKVHQINDAWIHRHHWTLAMPPFGSGAALEQKARYAADAVDGAEPIYVDVERDYWCANIYRRFDRRAVHSLGLTDAVLARTRTPTTRPSHKGGLVPMAEDLVEVYRANGEPPGAGMFRAAVAEGRAAPWIAANLETLERIERKVFNRHRVGENLRLAFDFPDRVEPPPRRRRRRPARDP